jgi:ABC-type antimicrobial peptide transport system permease subunit
MANEVPVLMRSTLPSSETASAIRRVAASVDSRCIVRSVNVGDELLRESLAPTRFAMALLGAFAATALLLAVAGLYGVIAYSVGQRTREIGVRVALGADSGAIARLVLGTGLRLAITGILIGAAAATAATRALTSMLYGVTSSDPLTFGAIMFLVAGVALLATYLPARRASMIDPTEALRAE